ncbi:hypothetical protein RLEG12_09550 (plasmid) [Rhizobium leguminosarum bv. trifolii CB782]|nr:hypothetical protein RLEG12_09550 [Rhizobium leguminosarum bv. trifolii CB782]
MEFRRYRPRRGWKHVDEQTGFHLLDAFVDHGFHAIDTAHRQSLANRLKLAPAVQR